MIHSSNDNLIYRLERLDGWQKTDSLHDLGSLPSFTDELRKQLLDEDNSYTSEETSDTHSLGFNMQWNIPVGDDGEYNAFGYVQVFPRVGYCRIYKLQIGLDFFLILAAYILQGVTYLFDARCKTVSLFLERHF